MIDYSGLHEPLRGGVQRYIEDKIKPGSFLTCMLCGDLDTAKEAADPYNKLIIDKLCLWFAMNIPPESWGTKEAVEKWLNS